MYADEVEQEKAAAPRNEPEGLPSPDEHPSSPSRAKSQRWTATTDIMLLGPSGSGKSSVVNLVSGDNGQVASEGTGLCTTHFRITQPFNIGERSFRLIDSPGFHTTSLNDSDLIKKLIVYLVKSRSPRLSGILYLHPEGKNARDENIKRTMEALRRLVGDPWLPSVVIAVIGDGTTVGSDTIAQLQEPTSPFYPLCSGGTKVLPLSLGLRNIQEILLGLQPSSSPPRFFQRVSWSPYNRFIDGLGPLIEEVMSHRRESGGKTGRSRKITYEESETTRQQLQATLDETETELKSLRSQLEQTQLEYASLRSELQLNDNTEQSKIVQLLQDLNRSIDDFGRSVAEYMVDNFAASFSKDSPTTLDASDFTELQRQFGHQVGKSSLAVAFTGDGLPIEDLIDLGLRNFLCQNLLKNVFTPFHPTLAANAEPDFMSTLYDEVRRQVSPIVAAKWRASSFKALSKGKRLDKPTIEEHAKSLITQDIQQLFNNIFGQASVVSLNESQCTQLQDILVEAWELNYVLKGEVVTLGDFQPLFYERGVPFDPKTMVEFEPDRKRKPGGVAICTVRMGLTLSYSKGTGKGTGPLVVCPATVVTPTIYGLNK